jgi:hypothetical protein
MKIYSIALATLGAAVIGISAAPRPANADTVIITRHHHMRMPGNDIRVIVNDQPVQFEGPGPIMMDGSHVFVPIRGIFEQMGGNVDWHEDAQVVEGAKPGHMFRIKIDSTDAVVNGDQVTLDTPPQLIDGTTYVPLRFTSEALGASVHWHADTNTVSINSQGDQGSDNNATIHRYHEDNGDTTTIIRRPGSD